MPKSRGVRRNKRGAKAKSPAAARMDALIVKQRKAFIAKFGREPEPGDPVFFDPDADRPTPLPSAEDEVLQGMAKSDVPPEFAYAVRKTGLLGLGRDKSLWPKLRIAEWNSAVDEYRAMQRALRRPNRPDPEQWSTQISELVIDDFTQDDLDLVLECIDAIAVIEERQPRKGFKLSARIELAAVLLATAAAAGYRSGQEAVRPPRGPAIHQ